jgi:hypothetical protein
MSSVCRGRRPRARPSGCRRCPPSRDARAARERSPGGGSSRNPTRSRKPVKSWSPISTAWDGPRCVKIHREAGFCGLAVTDLEQDRDPREHDGALSGRLSADLGQCLGPRSIDEGRDWRARLSRHAVCAPAAILGHGEARRGWRGAACRTWGNGERRRAYAWRRPGGKGRGLSTFFDTVPKSSRRAVSRDRPAADHGCGTAGARAELRIRDAVAFVGTQCSPAGTFS